MEQPKKMDKTKWYDGLIFLVCLWLCYQFGQLVGRELYFHFQNRMIAIGATGLTTAVTIYAYIVFHSRFVKRRGNKSV
mgnify:CR=1|tara:strand:- start:664 stop:897 length:234 start_codon:yes stop_codon:yes gene_type:complete